MSNCDSCQKNDNNNASDCTSCKGYCSIDADTLKAFRLCEPWCGNFNGPECLPPTTDCKAGACSTTGKVFSPLSQLLLAGVKGGCISVCTDASTGKTGFAVPGGPCIVSLDESQCAQFGVHFNAARRGSMVSPTAADAIAKTYAYETVTSGVVDQTTSARPVVGSPGWFVFAIGSIGLSHQFCITEVLATFVDGALNPSVTPIGVALGGERIACGDGDSSPEGFYVLVGDTPVKADPTALNITEFRCACAELCARTPADGVEFVYVQFAIGDGPGQLPDGSVPIVQAKLTRCRWAKVVEPCVGGIGNRRTTVAGLEGPGLLLARPAQRDAAFVPFL